MENSKAYADLARSRAVFYTPTVGSTVRELRQELPRLIDRVDICIDQHVRPKDGSRLSTITAPSSSSC